MKRPYISSPIDVKVEAAVNPSENPDRVIDAMATVVQRCSPEFRYGSRAIGKATGSESLSLIYEQVRSRSARSGSWPYTRRRTRALRICKSAAGRTRRPPATSLQAGTGASCQ